jgi:hypothetical protein
MTEQSARIADLSRLSRQIVARFKRRKLMLRQWSGFDIRTQSGREFTKRMSNPKLN